VIRLIRNGARIEEVDALQDFQAGTRKLQLEKPGSIKWHSMRLEWGTEALKGAKRGKMEPGNEIFDADAVGKEAIIRHWQPGDRYQPIGMKGAIKLQDLFVNQKVQRGDRRRRVIGVRPNGEIFWVEGMRISERFKLTDQTIRRLHWAWHRL
jgi:tRNA(Ile)-lysidine synthase